MLGNMTAPPNFPSQENLEDYAGSSKKHLGGDDVGPAPALPKKQCLSIPSPEKINSPDNQLFNHKQLHHSYFL
ncbi:hypothetical protein POPTR_004G075950v4 [Populus trichocarpa]|uniref:Uncharacterized protein n=1 Tax=Populus trichocarpa TaxID=3694 RepID=A0ACC0T4D0_POPTR|nr:hypothetical protein POPTR_004G075950v4 [Populus trichocarpa]